ncbi:MAG: hypothetical protein ACYC3F_11190 [Gemmatimonadaceae bacterium]
MRSISRRASVLCTAALAILPACGDSQATKYAGPYGDLVGKYVPQVEKATGLTFKTPPNVEQRSTDEVRAFLEKEFNENLPALELEGASRAYKLLGFLPDTMDLRRFMLRLLSEQVIGYYDPATKVLYVVNDTSAGRAALVEVTIAHELVHALQDQYVSLDSIQKQRDDNDRLTAAQAVMEGQATYEQMSTMLGGDLGARMPGGWDRVREMIRENQTAMPVFASAPMLLQESLLFPYLSGAEFMHRFKSAKTGRPPWEPLPASTEQVMHFDKYVAGERPVRVELPPLLSGNKVYENDLGEFETRLFLFQALQDLGTSARSAEGWGGDRYVVADLPGGAGLVWVTVWDTPIDAGEFRDASQRAAQRRLGAAGTGNAERKRFEGKGRVVEIVAATLQGKAAIIWTDVPAGSGTRLIDAAKVRLTER